MNWQIGLGVAAIILIVIAVWSFIRPQGGAYRLTSREAGKYGYSIWRYFNGAWHMTEDFSVRGYMPGPAPTGKARFEGQCTRVISVKRPSGS